MHVMLSAHAKLTMSNDSNTTNAISGNVPINLFFLCLARNCEETIPLFFSYLDRLENSGFRCAGIVGENGSSDGTRKLLEQKTGSRIELLDTVLMAEAPSRLVRMAIGRQALLDWAKNRVRSDTYICVADLDNVMMAPPEPVFVRKAIELLISDRTLFAIGATSRPVYYDLLSLRTEGHDYSQLNAEIAHAKKNPLSYYRFHQQRMYKNQRLMTRPEPISCASSFNGYCLYPADDYFLGSYRADNEADICEHVSFNLSIARATGRRMLILPDLVIQTPADHGPVGFFRFWADRIPQLFRRVKS